MLISLLQSVYDSNRPMPPHSHYALNSILTDIGLFGISSQVYHLLNTFGLIGEFPLFFQNELKAKFHQTSIQNLLLKHKEEEVLQLFERQGIAAIPLKGVRFAENYFGHFAARITSDIDLLVREDQFANAIACLESDGYRYEITKDHHARLHHNGLLIELHWTLDIPDWSNLQSHVFWNSAESLMPYKYIKELSPLHTLYFICLHGARHQMNSLRYLLDVVQVLDTHAGNIDLQTMMEQARADRTSKRIQAVLSIVYSQFPHLHAIKPLPFPSKETPWKYEIIRSALFGEKTKAYYVYKFFFRHFMFDTWKHSVKSVRKSY